MSKYFGAFLVDRAFAVFHFADVMLGDPRDFCELLLSKPFPMTIGPQGCLFLTADILGEYLGDCE